MVLTTLKTVLFSLRAHGCLRRFLTCNVAVLAALLAMFLSIGVAWYREYRQLGGSPAARSELLDARGVPTSPVGLRCRQLRTDMGSWLGAGGQTVRWHYVADTRNGSAWQVVAHGSEYLWVDVTWLARQHSEAVNPAGVSQARVATQDAASHQAEEDSAQPPIALPATDMSALAASPMFKGCHAARLQELVANGTGFGQLLTGSPNLPARASLPTEEGLQRPLEPLEVRQSPDLSAGLSQPRTVTVASRANLRAGPNLNFAVREVVAAGTAIVVVDQSFDEQWLKTEGGSWIHRSVVVLDPQAGTDQ